VRIDPMPARTINPTNPSTMDILVPIFAIVFTFGTAFGIVYLIYSTRHRERMTMIERGMDPDGARPAPDPNKSMRDGLLYFGIGLGLLAGWLMNRFVMGPGDGSVLAYFIGPAIFGGLSLVLYYLKFSNKQEG